MEEAKRVEEAKRAEGAKVVPVGGEGQRGAKGSLCVAGCPSVANVLAAGVMDNVLGSVCNGRTFTPFILAYAHKHVYTRRTHIR